MTSVAYGIAMPTTRGILAAVSPYSAEAAAFFARLATQPTGARKGQYDTLIRALVSAGVWAKLDALYLFAAADQATALTNLVQTSYGATAVNGPVFAADVGFSGGAAKCINSGFNPATAASPRWVQDSAHAGAWMLTDSAVNGVADIGATSNATLINAQNASGQMSFAINAAVGSTTSAGASSRGHSVASRTGPSLTTPYRNAMPGTVSSTLSTAPFNAAVTFLGAGATASSARQIVAGHFGGGLTAADVAALYDALHAYLQAVAGVP